MGIDTLRDLEIRKSALDGLFQDPLSCVHRIKVLITLHRSWWRRGDKRTKSSHGRGGEGGAGRGASDRGGREPAVATVLCGGDGMGAAGAAGVLGGRGGRSVCGVLCLVVGRFR